MKKQSVCLMDQSMGRPMLSEAETSIFIYTVAILFARPIFIIIIILSFMSIDQR